MAILTGVWSDFSEVEDSVLNEVDDALVRIKAVPTAAGHFLNTGSAVVTDVRRRNLGSFPYFVLYGLHANLMVYGAPIPSASDPLTWLNRFSRPA